MASLKSFYSLTNRQSLSPKQHIPIRRYYLTAMLILVLVFVVGYVQLLQLSLRGDVVRAEELERVEIVALLTTGVVCIVITLFIFRPMEQRMRRIQHSLLSEIEAHRQIESILSHSESLYRLLAQNLPQIAVILFDTDLRYMLAEGSILEAAGYSKTKLEGKTIYEALPPEALQFVEPNYRAALNGQEIEFERETMNGSLVYHARISPIRDEENVIVGGMLLIQDITQRKRIDAESREREQITFSLAIEKERSQVLATFIQDSSHDLRTPLTVIATNLYLLRKTSTPEMAPRFDMLDKQVWQLNHLIDDLHTMSKLDMETTIERRPVDVNRMVQDLHQQVSMKVEKKQQSLVLDLQANLPRLPADERHLKQALTNVIDNAIVYTNDGGTITIKTASKGDEILISVHDDGIGIAPEYHDLIFRHFYKVDAARTGGKSGSGLGLAMVKRIVDLHGGRIEVESEPDHGSLFRFRLPLSKAD